jgi:hypothetical protein
VLRAPATLEGVIVYADGQPIADVEISARLESDSPSDPVGRTSGRTRTDDDGRFRLRALQPGRYHLYPKHYALEERDRYSYHAATDGPETRMVLDLHRLRVLFEDERGRSVMPTDTGCYSWRAAESGAMRALAAGTPLPRDVEEGHAIGAAGSIHDLLVPRDSWWWIVADTNGHHADALVQASGPGNETDVTLTLKLLEPGRHLLTVTADGYAPASISVLVEPGQFSDANVMLERR